MACTRLTPCAAKSAAHKAGIGHRSPGQALFTAWTRRNPTSRRHHIGLPVTDGSDEVFCTMMHGNVSKGASLSKNESETRPNPQPVTIVGRIVFAITAVCLVGLAIQGLRIVRDTVTSTCQYDITQLVPAPGGQHIMVVAVKNCGATTPYITTVRIVRTGAGFATARPAASDAQDDTETPDVFAVRGKQQLNVVWRNAKTVEITAPHLSAVYTQGTQQNGVEIRYQ